MQARSVAKVPEHDLVEAIFGDHFLRTSVGVPPQTPEPHAVRLRVRPFDLGLPESEFGDVDALLVPAGAPQLSRAAEFKKIRITTKSLDTGLPGGLNELGKAVHQANALARAGFSHVWLMILVASDSRGRTSRPFEYLAAPRHLVGMVLDTLPLARLESRVGVCIHEIAQSIDAPFTEHGLRGGHVVRLAEAASQSESLTRGIADYLARTCNPRT